MIFDAILQILQRTEYIVAITSRGMHYNNLSQA
jgi:hypothetical protein